jgi:hypothetical protein
MSLSAWERHTLDSIKDELAASDPELAALLSAFNRLASDEEMPNRTTNTAGPRRTLRLRRPGSRPSFRRVRQRPGLRRIVLLVVSLLTIPALIAVGQALNAGGDHVTCPETIAMVACVSQAPGHSPDSLSHNTTSGQGSQQRVVGILQARP